IEAHHDDVVANTIEAVLVKVADAISAGRPGARRDTLEIYIKRLQKIEEIVNSPRICANPYTLLLSFRNFSGFYLQDEHKRFVNQYVRLGSSPNQWQK
ncbi:MAG: hypothetical protein II088_06835, partial [Bacteroidales bacterium]|nr:hypothetical protein [Bacteroidales bacterium]